MEDGFWVFGYGSLMWNPGFRYAERHVAELEHHHRSFCLASVRYRGTPEHPGLVLALEPQDGAKCRGVAYRVERAEAQEALAYLRERELVTGSYHERYLPLSLIGTAREVTAICYVVDMTHPQYRCGMSLEEKARVIAASVGPAGPNRDYLFNTLCHMRELAVDDPEMEEIAALVERRWPVSPSAR